MQFLVISVTSYKVCALGQRATSSSLSVREDNYEACYYFKELNISLHVSQLRLYTSILLQGYSKEISAL